MKKKTNRIVRTRNNKTWTESMFFSAIRSALRMKFRYWKPMTEALKKASRPSQNKKRPALKTEYQCAMCLKWFDRKSVEVNHIIPCGSLSKYEDIVPFVKRLTEENIDLYNVLCKPCHKKETKKQRNGKNI